MNIKLSYEQYYSKNFLQIDKFSITELCEKLQLPKETVRRKVLELEKLGVLKRQNDQLLFVFLFFLKLLIFQVLKLFV